MQSLIDPTRPLDGVPAVKSDLRNNLQTAKDELDLTLGRTSDVVYLSDFSPVADGVTDDTAPLQAAIDKALSERKTRVMIVGEYAIDCAALNFSNVSVLSNLELVINGRIRCRSTLRVTQGISLLGIGPYRGSAFSLSLMGGIGPHPDLPSGDALVEAVGVGQAKVIRRIDFQQHDGPLLRIGFTSAEANQSAFFVVDECSFLAQNIAGSTPILIENSYWIYMSRCAVASQQNAGPSIHFADSYDPGFGNNGSGLFHMNDCNISEHGIVINGFVDGGHWNFKNIHYEASNDPFITIDKTSGNVWGLTMENIGKADTTNVTSLISDVTDSLVDFQLTGSPNFESTVFVQGSNGRVPSSYHVMQPNLSATATAEQQYELGYPDKPHIFYDGGLDTVVSLRGRGLSSTSLPADVQVLPVSNSPANWDVGTGINVTPNQLAPDGTSSATLVENTDASIRQIQLMNPQPLSSVNAGDWIIHGTWAKSADGKFAGEFLRPLRIVNGSNGTFNQKSTANIFTPRFAYAKEQQIGWNLFSAIAQVTTPGTILSLQFQWILQRANDAAFLWHPFFLVIPASYKKREVVAIQSEISVIPEGMTPMSHTVPEGHVIRTMGSPTAGRPNAASVGAGASYFDQTLNEPIWSDGTNWRDLNKGIV